MADATDLKSVEETRMGSTPILGTNQRNKEMSNTNQQLRDGLINIADQCNRLSLYNIENNYEGW